MTDDPYSFLDKPAAPALSPVDVLANDPFGFLDKAPFRSQDRLEPVAPYNSSDALAHGLTLGLSDPIRALAMAGKRYVAGQTPDFDYGQASREVQRGRELYAENNPIANLVNNIAGGLTTGGIASLGKVPVAASATPPSLFGQIARGTGIGAGMGAVMGAADNSDTLANAARGALHGAEMAAPLGAAVPLAMSAGPAAYRMTRGLINPSGTAADDAAIAALAQRQATAVRGGGPTLAQIGTRLDTAEAPLAIGDVAGRPVQSYLGTLSRANTPAAQVIEDAIQGRDRGAGARMVGVINRDVSAAPSAYDAVEAITAAQKTASAPAYETAYSAPPLNPDHIAYGGDLDLLMKRPAMVRAARNALGIAAEEGRDPASLGITFNHAGDPVFERVPSWQTLDYVKRGLDDVLDSHRNDFGKLVNLGEGGRAVVGTVKAFTNFLDRENPAYAAARAEFAGPARLKNAINMGRDFLSDEPEQIRDLVAGFGPSEKQGFLLGAAQSLRDRVEGVSRGGNEAAKLDYSVGLDKKLRQLFNSDAEFESFMKPISDENVARSTFYKLYGNSSTAGRLAADASSDVPGANAAALGAVASNNPMGALGIMASKYVVDPLSRVLSGQTPQAQTAAANMLTTTNPAYQKMVLERLGASYHKPGQYISPLSGIIAGVPPLANEGMRLLIPNSP